jgi:hypothetical protein
MGRFRRKIRWVCSRILKDTKVGVTIKYTSGFFPVSPFLLLPSMLIKNVTEKETATLLDYCYTRISHPPSLEEGDDA